MEPEEFSWTVSVFELLIAVMPVFVTAAFGTAATIYTVKQNKKSSEKIKKQEIVAEQEKNIQAQKLQEQQQKASEKDQLLDDVLQDLSSLRTEVRELRGELRDVQASHRELQHLYNVSLKHILNWEMWYSGGALNPPGPPERPLDLK